jgi:glycine hydroxymethyltransferase
MMLATRTARSFAGVRRAARGITTDAMRVNAGLAEVDPEIHSIIEAEKTRLKTSVCLIPSENFAPRCILEAVGSVMTNKYSEGYPGRRYYGGNEFIDQAESLCQKRALEAFGLDPAEWGVNVQSLSGSPANFQTYTALLDVHDRIMALDLPHGGHLSHGYQLPNKKISMVSKYFESMPYRLDESTGLIDYDELEKFALRYRPKLLVCGASAYSRLIDYARFREIADKVGAILLCDMAHVSGLIAGKALPSCFPHVDVVTTTTHKSLRGPRGAMIFYRQGVKGTDKKGNEIKYDFADKINSAVFPGLQGGPHNHTITALAVALKEAASPQFHHYQHQVLKNAKQMEKTLLSLGYNIVSGGTDNHLLLVDLRNQGINGAVGETICEMANITLNKNTVPGDVSALHPSGLRIGSPAMTSRGLVEPDFEQIVMFMNRAMEIAKEVQKDTGAKKLADFKKAVATPPPALVELRQDVTAFASAFDTVGH